MITSLEQLHTAWVDDDQGGDLIAVLENPEGEDRPHRPLLALPPLDALALAGQLIGLARDAIAAQAGVPYQHVTRIVAPADLGPALKQARRDAGLTCVALAATVGAGASTITTLENSSRHPRLPMLLDVLQGLGCELAVIRR